jgi:hypothetical protein
VALIGGMVTDAIALGSGRDKEARNQLYHDTVTSSSNRGRAAVRTATPQTRSTTSRRQPHTFHASAHKCASACLTACPKIRSPTDRRPTRLDLLRHHLTAIALLSGAIFLAVLRSARHRANGYSSGRIYNLQRPVESYVLRQSVQNIGCIALPLHRQLALCQPGKVNVEELRIFYGLFQ